MAWGPGHGPIGGSGREMMRRSFSVDEAGFAITKVIWFSNNTNKNKPLHEKQRVCPHGNLKMP